MLEVIGFNIESCIIAQNSGANRIELCASPADGGTTPSYGFIKAARRKLDIELYPIIRPRGGDFLYDDAEYDIMIGDIKLCKKLGCDGIVAGILTTDGSVDTKRCTALADLAYPLGITFHRAFDRVNDPFKALEDIIACGFERILTSGLQPTAMEGITLLASLVEKAGDRITIMPGSGVRSENIAAIASATKAYEFHTSARISTNTKMEFISQSMNENLRSVSADAEEIKKMIGILAEI